MFAFAFSLLFRRQRQSVFANPGIVIGAAVFFLVAGAAQALELAVPELDRVAVVGFDVVHELGNDDQVDGFAALAQRFEGELIAPASTPTPVIVRPTTVVLGAIKAPHALMLARASSRRKQTNAWAVNCSTAIRRGRDGHGGERWYVLRKGMGCSGLDTRARYQARLVKCCTVKCCMSDAGLPMQCNDRGV